MINWGVRFRNKVFWVTFIPAVLVLIKTVAYLFGFELDLTDLQVRLLAVVEAVFVLLSVLGVVVDSTTAGISDSARAMTYESPKDSDRLTAEGK